MDRAKLASSGAFWALAIGCGIIMGLADIVGLLIAKTIYGDKDDDERDVRVRFTGPALQRETGSSVCGTPVPSQSSQSSVLATPPQGILVPIHVTGTSRCGKTTMAKAFVTGSMPSNIDRTIGGDLLFKTVIQGKHKAYVQIWETELLAPEQQAPHSPSRQSMCSHILVYRTGVQGAVESLKAWHSSTQAQAHNQMDNSASVVLGNCFKTEEEQTKAESRKGISDMLSEIESFCKAHEICHFLMASEDDVETVQAAFQHVIDKGVQSGLQKRREAAAAYAHNAYPQKGIPLNMT